MTQKPLKPKPAPIQEGPGSSFIRDLLGWGKKGVQPKPKKPKK